jgi:hypothetical protein
MAEIRAANFGSAPTTMSRTPVPATTYRLPTPLSRTRPTFCP